MEDLKKTVQSVLYERIASPFSGAFVLSWFVWNWKFIYYLISVESNVSFAERIQFIDAQYINWIHTILLPFASGIFFVGIYPFISTGAMNVWLRHKRYQNELKNKIEKNQLLNFEQSLELRLQITNQKEKFEKIIQEKELEIKTLRFEKEELLKKFEPVSLQKETEEAFKRINENLTKENEEFKKILENPAMEKFPTIMGIVTRSAGTGTIPVAIISYFESLDIIQKISNSPGRYDWTEKGKRFLKFYHQKEKKE